MTTPTASQWRSAQPMPEGSSTSCKPIGAEELREILDYDPESGLLTWRLRMSSRSPAGSVAGSLKSDSGYILICINRRIYRAHRLAWLHVHGVWPQGHIDHVNGVRHDNRLANLREASNAENQQNLHRPHADNSCGLLGVSRNHKGFRARIKFDGKVLHLGTFKTPEKAHNVYLAAKRKYHSHCAV